MTRERFLGKASDVLCVQDDRFDLQDYLRPMLRRPTRKRGRDLKLVVDDDWPRPIPATDQEVDLFVAHFDAFFDEMFGNS